MTNVSGFLVVNEMTELLSPRKLGYGVPGGIEAAIHVVIYKVFSRVWLLSMP